MTLFWTFESPPSPIWDANAASIQARRARMDLKNPLLQSRGSVTKYWTECCCWGPGDGPTRSEPLRAAQSRQTSEEAGCEVQSRPGGAAKGRRARMDGESRTRSLERPPMLLRNFASFLRVPGFSQRRKSRNRKSDVLFSVFLHWQTRGNLSYSTSAPVQLPRNRPVHRLAAVPPAFPCFPFHFPARHCHRVHQRERLPGG